ncbi:hypothetical protein RchiOBHm_Chr7g0226981 [Rosa chinensis]|uniref:Uncharacterized protein n=1 Tax=Rosa chinensis TaxID=74649 RepID=A0A2P6PEH2_ROSCH|nr:hypothetical protein RchiOBHm_Chr7g0226981 [Rosa chinensis]
MTSGYRPTSTLNCSSSGLKNWFPWLRLSVHRHKILCKEVLL